MAVYGYSRVSVTRQAEEGESLDVQRRQLEGYVMQHGWTLTHVYREEGVSGSVPLAERPEGRKLLDALQPGDVVCASKLDRVFRSALDALQMVEHFRARGVSLHLLDLGGDVSGNGLSKLFLTVAAAFAEAERDRIRERVSQTKADQKKRGRYLGGKLPFGYRLGDDGALTADQREQRLLHLAHRLHSEGKPLRAIQSELADQGAALSIGGLHKLLKKGRDAASSVDHHDDDDRHTPN